MALLSVVIPAYNAGAYLAEAVESVLAQAYRPIEIIVVDDGSTDNTAEAATPYANQGLRYVRQDHAGVGKALNRGISEANGKYLAFLDADDLWTPEKVSVQLHALTSDPEVDMVFGMAEQFYSHEIPEAEHHQISLDQPNGAFISKGTMLIRRETFNRVGGFDEKIVVGDFIDWYLRAQEAGLKPAMLQELVLRRRVHGTNMGIQSRDHRVDYVRVLKAARDRRKSLGHTT